LALGVTLASDLSAKRFRGYLPIVVDVETGGFHAKTDALLEIAFVIIKIDAEGRLSRGATHAFHVQPFEGARLDPASLEFNGIDPFHPLRPALPEAEVLRRCFTEVRAAIRAQACRRGILVGHNAAFDLGFLNAAVERCGIKRNPFHPFSCLDTVTLAGAALGQTVLARAAKVVGLDWDNERAHGAVYDAEQTAELFCRLSNDLHASFLAAEERATAMGLQDRPQVPFEMLEET
jgi:ribonuclease T